VKVAIRVQKRRVASDEPAIDEELDIGFGVVVVLPEDGGAFDLELAFFQRCTNGTGRRVRNTNRGPVTALSERNVIDDEVLRVARGRPRIVDATCLQSG
jgi:hypothetical protein